MKESNETLRKSHDTQAILGAIAQLSQNIAQIGVDVNSLKSDVALLKSDVAELKSDVAILKADVAELKSDVAILKADVAELKSDVAILKADVAELKGEIVVLKKRLDKLESFIVVQFDAVREGIVYNRVKFDRLEARVFDAHSEISNMRADITELTQVIQKRVHV